jgi:hypothetical protein
VTHAGFSEQVLRAGRINLELERRNGQRWVFASGDVLWLVGLPILSLYNRGYERVVLVAASRRLIVPAAEVDQQSP